MREHGGGALERSVDVILRAGPVVSRAEAIDVMDSWSRFRATSLLTVCRYTLLRAA